MNVYYGLNDEIRSIELVASDKSHCIYRIVDRHGWGSGLLVPKRKLAHFISGSVNPRRYAIIEECAESIVCIKNNVEGDTVLISTLGETMTFAELKDRWCISE